jgi:hypothetical protein
MRKLRVLLLSIIVSLFLLAPMIRPTQQVKAGFYEEHYTVIYTCTCSPNCQGMIVGEWSVDCFGNWSGWGWRPGEDVCSESEVSYGNECIW